MVGNILSHVFTVPFVTFKNPYTMQILMSVLVVMIIALIMLTVLTLMVATTVHVILDILEMASTAQVY